MTATLTKQEIVDLVERHTLPQWRLDRREILKEVEIKLQKAEEIRIQLHRHIDTEPKDRAGWAAINSVEWYREKDRLYAAWQQAENDVYSSKCLLSASDVLPKCIADTRAFIKEQERWWAVLAPKVALDKNIRGDVFAWCLRTLEALRVLCQSLAEDVEDELQAYCNRIQSELNRVRNESLIETPREVTKVSMDLLKLATNPTFRSLSRHELGV